MLEQWPYSLNSHHYTTYTISGTVCPKGHKDRKKKQRNDSLHSNILQDNISCKAQSSSTQLPYLLQAEDHMQQSLVEWPQFPHYRATPGKKSTEKYHQRYILNWYFFFSYSSASFPAIFIKTFITAIVVWRKRRHSCSATIIVCYLFYLLGSCNSYHINRNFRKFQEFKWNFESFFTAFARFAKVFRCKSL